MREFSLVSLFFILKRGPFNLIFLSANSYGSSNDIWVATNRIVGAKTSYVKAGNVNAMGV
jgi:hypothetical protein